MELCDTGINTDPMTKEFSFPTFTEHFEQLPGYDQGEAFALFFVIACKSRGINPVPHRYIRNSLSAMSYLQSRKKCNILDGTAYVFGNLKADKSDSRFPTNRMPFGLLEHCINFYSANSSSEVQ